VIRLFSFDAKMVMIFPYPYAGHQLLQEPVTDGIIISLARISTQLCQFHSAAGCRAGQRPGDRRGGLLRLAHDILEQQDSDSSLPLLKWIE
jgi:hypothetical protein